MAITRPPAHLAARLAQDGGTPVRRAAFPEWPVWDEADEPDMQDIVEAVGKVRQRALALRAQPQTASHA